MGGRCRVHVLRVHVQLHLQVVELGLLRLLVHLLRVLALDPLQQVPHDHGGVRQHKEPSAAPALAQRAAVFRGTHARPVLCQAPAVRAPAQHDRLLRDLDALHGCHQ
jgi:hypothetical protein